MNDQIQTLIVASRLFPLLVRGEKTSTIRWRETPISPGLMRYLCDSDQNRWVVVDVFRCTEMPLSIVAEYLGNSQVWPDDVMLEGMREHYPKIELTSIVQVIEHGVPLEFD